VHLRDSTIMNSGGGDFGNTVEGTSTAVANWARVGDASLTVERCRFLDNHSAFSTGLGSSLSNIAGSSTNHPFTATLRVTDSTFTGDYSGVCAIINTTGALDNTRAVLEMERCTIRDNSVGGICNFGGRLIVKDTTIDGMNSIAPAIFTSRRGTLDMTGCTISNNQTHEPAASFLRPGQVQIANSTFSNNRATGSGDRGAMHISTNIASPIVVTNSTFVNNRSPEDFGITSNVTGNGAITLDLSHSIFQRAVGGENFAPQQNITVISRGYNISDDDFGGKLTGTGDKIDTDPLLGALADNGGPTKTHMPLAGSPAIDAGDPAFDLAVMPYDQRGYVRIFGGRVDIGAVETSSYLNTPPIADAGSNQVLRFGVPVVLDGSGSDDDNTDRADLLFAWEFLSKPGGSQAQLTGANTTMPSFVPDVAGDYVVQLTVTDNAVPPLSSAPAFVTISSDNQAPTGQAAATPQLPLIGQTVTLSSAGTEDAENDPLSYSWELTSAPAGSTAVIAAADSATATIVPDKAGSYTVLLTPSDFLGAGTPAEATFTASVPMTAADHLRAAAAYAETLSGSAITSKGNLNAFTQFLQQALRDLQQNRPDKALNSIAKAMKRTDGIPLRGSVDQHGPSRDWILTAPAQTLLYGKLLAARTVVAGM
jgi:hypothetical protein